MLCHIMQFFVSVQKLPKYFMRKYTAKPIYIFRSDHNKSSKKIIIRTVVRKSSSFQLVSTKNNCVSKSDSKCEIVKPTPRLYFRRSFVQFNYANFTAGCGKEFTEIIPGLFFSYSYPLTFNSKFSTMVNYYNILNLSANAENSS